MPDPPAVPAHRALTLPRRRCVLIVHGVGEQKKSDTLLFIGSPLVDWVLRWARQFYGRSAAQVGPVELSFVPFDVGDGDRPPYALLDLPGERWYLAEAWWAGSSFHPDLMTMLRWSIVHLFDILAQMLRNTAERVRNLLHPKDPRTSSQPARVWQLVDLFNCVVLGVAYAIVLVVGYVLLVPLMILAQIPIESVQDFILLTVLKPLLTAAAGEFRMFLDDEIQSANIRRRVAAAARSLMLLADCDELVIVAHSEGCVVSLGMLTDPVHADVTRRTRKLLTFGAGLNKSWLVKPSLERLFTPLEGDVLWTDFWASYDPVPAGPLDPSPRVINGRKVQIADIYKPSGDALAQVGPGNGPRNEQVTNNMNVVTDHGGYFTNDEQVVIRLAAEISSQRHTESAFWPANEVLLDGARNRRARVSALALWRDVTFLCWAMAALAPWLLGWIRGIGAWDPLTTMSPSSIGPAGIVLNLLRFMRDSLPSLLAPIAGLAAMLLQLPALVGLAALLGIVVWGLYSLVERAWWQPWDTVARAAFLKACVDSGRARLRASSVPGTPSSLTKGP
jgi:hypothetical protein